MSTIHKLVKNAIEEIKMAEKYIGMAEHSHDATIANKFQEIAKEEIKHFDHAHAMIKKEIEEKSTKGKNVMEWEDSPLHKEYKKWADKVKERVNTFRFVQK